MPDSGETTGYIIRASCLIGIAGAFVYSRFYQKKVVSKSSLVETSGENASSITDVVEEALKEIQTDDLELSQFRYAWGIQAYLRFTNLPFFERNVAYPSTSAGGPFPLLRHGNRLFGRTQRILEHLRELEDLDESLTQHEKSLCLAYTALIHHKLISLIRHRRYVDESVFQTKTLTELRSVLPWPLNYFIPTMLRNDELLHHKHSSVGDLSPLEVDQTVVDIFRSLSSALQDKSKQSDEVNDEFGDGKKKTDILKKTFFFFGEKPSSLDAILWGSLAEIMNEPQLGFADILKGKVVLGEETIEKFPVLLEYYYKIRNRYFCNDVQNTENSRHSLTGGPFGLNPSQNFLLLHQNDRPDFIPGIPSQKTCRRRGWGNECVKKIEKNKGQMCNSTGGFWGLFNGIFSSQFGNFSGFSSRRRMRFDGGGLGFDSNGVSNGQTKNTAKTDDATILSSDDEEDDEKAYSNSYSRRSSNKKSRKDRARKWREDADEKQTSETNATRPMLDEDDGGSNTVWLCVAVGSVCLYTLFAVNTLGDLGLLMLMMFPEKMKKFMKIYGEKDNE